MLSREKASPPLETSANAPLPRNDKEDLAMLNGISCYHVNWVYRVLLLVLSWTLDAVSLGMACASACRRRVREWTKGPGAR